MSADIGYQAGMVALGLAAGLAAGAVHFATLGRVVRLLTDGPALHALALQVGRFALTGGVLVGLALLGAGALVAGLVGVMVARQVVLRRLGGAP